MLSSVTYANTLRVIKKIHGSTASEPTKFTEWMDGQMDGQIDD